MSLAALDWAVIAGYFVLALGFGIYFSRRASRSTEDFFVAGRSLPWWVLGTSMVATTFAADTPLAVTGLVAENGIAGNWFWWSLAFSHVLAATLFARLWRRAKVLTDAELCELRYDGRSARWLRSIKAFYFAVPINCLTMGWVILAMAKITHVLFDWHQVLPPGWMDVLDASWPSWLGTAPPPDTTDPAPGIAPRWDGFSPSDALSIGILMVFTVVYSTLSGLWGVVATDLIQFGMAMTGSILLAVFAVQGQGGTETLLANLDGLYDNADEIVAFFPGPDAEWMPLTLFLSYLGVQWWAQKYADGGGILIQRMSAAKDERHAFWGTMWFAVAHYVLRPWTWILVAVCALVVYPMADFPTLDREMSYAVMMRDLMPVGLLGLLAASLIAAFMSTIDTHLNWGASYVVNDLYRPFTKVERGERHYVMVSRITQVSIALLAALLASFMTSIKGAWAFLIVLGSGTGLVILARWFWWRVSAAAELTALGVSTGTALLLYAATDLSYGAKLVVVVVVSSTAWIAVALWGPRTSAERLAAFHQRVRPGGPGWGPVRAGLATASASAPLGLLGFLRAVGAGPVASSEPTAAVLVGMWLLGLGTVFCGLFGLGSIFFGSALEAACLLGSAVVCGVVLVRGGRAVGG